MICPKCGSENPNKSKFCNKCGYDLEEFRKQEKEKAKEKTRNTIYKIKVKIVLVLLIVLLISIAIVVGLYFVKDLFKGNNYEEKQQENVEEYDENETIGELVEKIEVTEENKDLDYDKDGLKNEEEGQYGTSLISSDTDNDGLSDYDEINRYKSDPLKYSTSGDGISDYIKVEKDLDINTKYNRDDIKIEEVKKGYNITLIPKDLESEIYGGLEEFSNDTRVNSTHKVFNLLDFEGKVKYTTNNKDSVLLLRQGTKYKEFTSYKNKDGVLEIEITKDDNYKDFVITTRENYEKYINS